MARGAEKRRLTDRERCAVNPVTRRTGLLRQRVQKWTKAEQSIETLHLEGVVMRWIFVLYQGERACYEGSVLLWYSTGIKDEFRRRDNRKDTHDDTPWSIFTLELL